MIWFDLIWFVFCISDGLKEQMDFDMMALNELQLAVYIFQEIVSIPYLPGYPTGHKISTL